MNGANIGADENFSPTVIDSFGAAGTGTKSLDITPLAMRWANGSAAKNGIIWPPERNRG